MHAKFRVGDRVRLPFGYGKVFGVVREDRGLISMTGRRVYGVEMQIDSYAPTYTERTEPDLEPFDWPAFDAMSLDEARDYLQSGGLKLILNGDLDDDRHQPRVWLCRSGRGVVTHTFNPERGGIGGAVVPAQTRTFEKILRSKRDEVVAFVQTFGFDRAAAEAIVDKVGVTRK